MPDSSLSMDLATSARRKEQLMGLLWAVSGAERGKVYLIADGSVAGRRRQCEIFLADAEVSDIHCRFTIEDGAFVVWDFGSKSGTWINGQRIRSATPLTENDEVRLGSSVFLLKTLPERRPER
ncbi:MAG: FHA domain-containing protein [Anaerolineae bacterium]|nr:FHA domain-containing protein [Anaerolineae bacterium]